MTNPTCANCGERIELGERRRPMTDGVTHDRCLVMRSTPLEWHHDEQQMRFDDLIIGLQADFETDIPEWVVGAANAGRLRDGIVGHLYLMRDGSIQFRTETDKPEDGETL